MIRRNLFLVVSLFLLLFYGCLKNSSDTQSIAVSIDDKIYYYKPCSNSSICKFSCHDVTDTSSLTYQNIDKICNKEESCLTREELDDLFLSDDPIKENIINPILKALTLEFISVDYDSLKRFDDILNTKGYKRSGRYKCTPSIGVNYRPWLKTKNGSETIYKSVTDDDDLAKLQWSGLLKNANQKDLMTYEEAKNTCKNYRFGNFSNWRLPSSEELEKVASSINSLGKQLNLNSKDLVWSSTEVNNQVKVLSIKKVNSPQLSDKNNLLYTVCVREYRNDN